MTLFGAHFNSRELNFKSLFSRLQRLVFEKPVLFLLFCKHLCVDMKRAAVIELSLSHFSVILTKVIVEHFYKGGKTHFQANEILF